MKGLHKSYNNYPCATQATQYFFLSKYYRWGGTVTFTAHLLNSIGRQIVLGIANRRDQVGKRRSFGYGIKHRMVHPQYLDKVSRILITDLFGSRNFLGRLRRANVTVVIHDPTHLSNENIPYLKYWSVICIRKSFQNYLERAYGIPSRFLYHPFYPYEVDPGRLTCQKYKAVSICRIDQGKNFELVTDANHMLNKSSQDSIEFFGPYNSKYVNQICSNETFNPYYHGTFKRSFKAISKILNPAKFVVDMSSILNDGGGTQYTFLEAIHHGAALIINRKWIENLPKKFRDFKEGYNCYAVSNAIELFELISNMGNIDTSQVVRNSKKLMNRHIYARWDIV